MTGPRGTGERKRRRRSERWGRRAETAAALWLQLKGYAILARRVRLAEGEIDLVARRGGRLAFVEVKARARREAGFDAVSPASRRRIERAADVWLARRPRLADLDLGFDLVIIAPWRPPLHLRDAWRADE